MEIRKRALQLGIFASAGIFAACGGGDEAEPAGDAGAPAPAAPAPSAGGAGTVPVPANLPAGVTGDMIQQGQAIFVGNGICFTCHGQNAQGTPLAPNLTDGEWINITPGDNLYQDIVNLVNTGVPQPVQHPAPMPPKGGSQISDAEVQAVAAYVWALAQG